eukprot:15363434-Ditylum_brightwellii.AAC.1
MIQAWIRCIVAQKERATSLNAATMIQSRVRATLVRRTMTRYHIAATQIQSSWRCTYEQNMYKTMLHCVIQIQCIARRAISRSKFGLLCSSVIILQASFRCYKSRCQYLAQRRAIVQIQSAARQMGTRQQLERDHKAATTLQCAWRLYACQKKISRVAGLSLTQPELYSDHGSNHSARDHFFSDSRSDLIETIEDNFYNAPQKSKQKKSYEANEEGPDGASFYGWGEASKGSSEASASDDSSHVSDSEQAKEQMPLSRNLRLGGGFLSAARAVVANVATKADPLGRSIH